MVRTMKSWFDQILHVTGNSQTANVVNSQNQSGHDDTQEGKNNIPYQGLFKPRDSII